jgi:hypothetical protein
MGATGGDCNEEVDAEAGIAAELLLEFSEVAAVDDRARVFGVEFVEELVYLLYSPEPSICTAESCSFELFRGLEKAVSVRSFSYIILPPIPIGGDDAPRSSDESTRDAAVGTR